MKLPKGIKSFIVVPRREIKEFFITVTVQQLAIGAINIFEPIYLYGIGVSIPGIILYNLAAYAIYFFTISLGGKFAKKYGYEHSLAIGTFISSIYYIALALIPVVPWVLFLAPFILATQKTFWWPAYHANFARFSKSKEVGREIGSLNALYTLSSAIGPFIGGIILLFGNFTALYVFGVALMLVSVVPLFTTKEKFVPSKFSWREQMKYIFAKKYRHRLLAGMGYGEELLSQTIWPLFIFFTLGAALDVGVVIGLATILTILASIMTGRIMDRTKNLRTINVWSTVTIAISWLLRPFVNIAGTIFLADTTSRVGKFALMVPAYSKVYGDGKKNHVMTEVIGYEMALILGKVAMMAILLVVLNFVDVNTPYLFWLAVPFSLLYFLFR